MCRVRLLTGLEAGAFPGCCLVIRAWAGMGVGSGEGWVVKKELDQTLVTGQGPMKEKEGSARGTPDWVPWLSHSLAGDSDESRNLFGASFLSVS